MSETCPSTKALADLLCDLTVLVLGKPLLSESCYGKRGRDWKGLEVRPEVAFPGVYWLGLLGCTGCCHMRWICSTGETVSASIGILHITYTLHSYIYLNILIHNHANCAEQNKIFLNNIKLQFLHRWLVKRQFPNSNCAAPTRDNFFLHLHCTNVFTLY